MDERLSLNQLDALKELGTIGAGRAATALAELLGTKVEISVPEACIVPLEKISNLLPHVEEPFFVLDTSITGDLTGRIFLLFSPNDAKIIGSALLGKEVEEINNFTDPMFRSSLMECTNILSGSYLIALSEMTHLSIISSVPDLAMDMVGAILDFIFIQIAQYSEHAIFIETDLKVKDRNLDGLFLFFPDVESLNKIFEILRIA